MDLFFLSFVLCILSKPSQGNFARETCKEVKQNFIGNPCDLKNFVNITTLKQCVGYANLQTEQECIQKGCCWHKAAKNNSQNKCFSKPKKCYVDLRFEKCTYFRDGINGIYTGYSANNSYCHVTGIPITNEVSRQVLGYKHNDGYKIENVLNQPSICRSYWTYNVTILPNEKCEVRVINRSHSHAHGGVSKGKLQFGKNCVVQDPEGHFYSFALNEERRCMCRVDAWLEAKDEHVNVSEAVLKYVRDLENRSSCTQVLGNMIRNSWMYRVAPLNRVEVDVVVAALENLTKPNDVRNFTYLDASVLLHSTRKISGYSFYEGINPSSAANMVTTTATAVNNLIWRFSHLRKNTNGVDMDATVATSRLSDIEPEELQDSAQNESKVKFEIFKTLETITETIALHLSSSKEIDLRTNEKYIDLRIAVAAPQNVSRMLNHSQDLQSSLNDNKQNVITYVPNANSEANMSENVAVISAFYNFAVSASDPVQRVSDYLSVNLWKISGGNATTLSVPVEFKLKWTNTTYNRSKLSCQFLINYSMADSETFSDFGCRVAKVDEQEVTCRCNHTTHFAVLLKVTETEINEGHSIALKILSLVLGGLSIAALVVTVLVFIHCRKTLIKDRMLIHFHLILALLGGYVSLLISTQFSSIDQVASAPCVACAVSIHFFFLAVFFWSLVEGFYLFYKIVLVFQRKWVECLPTYAPIMGWLAPAIIVSVSFILSRTWLEPKLGDLYSDAYASPESCFLSQKSGMIWTFVIPVAAIILVNLCILLKVMVVIYSSNANSTRFATMNKATRITESLKRASRGALILMPILGIPWLIGFLYNFYTSDSNIGVVIGTMGAYLQVVLVGIQGILVFFFYCVYNADVRNAYALSARRRKSESSLQVEVSQRKRSRIPLLFSGSGDNLESNSRRDTIKLAQRTHSQGGMQTRRSTSGEKHGVAAGNEPVSYGRSTSLEVKQTLHADETNNSHT